MCFSPLLPGIFNGFAADGDEVMDGLPDGSTDESVDVQTEKSSPRYCVIRNSDTGILVGIFTMNLADGRTDGTGNRHTDIQMEFGVET